MPFIFRGKPSVSPNRASISFTVALSFSLFNFFLIFTNKFHFLHGLGAFTPDDGRTGNEKKQSHPSRKATIIMPKL